MVRTVKVDKRGIYNQIRNAADTLFQDLVRNTESFHHRRILRNNAADLVVRNNNERINVLFEVFQTFRRIVHTLFAFKIKRLRDDRDRKNL